LTDNRQYFAARAEFDEEDARLRLIEEGGDPDTLRRLERIGVAAGWWCLEVGAGAGSVAAWLGEQVGPSGRVVATDIDTRHLGWIGAPNITVRRHDVLTDELESGRYDLVHARALLEHLRDPGAALSRMTGALRPGGWLVAEGADFNRYNAADRGHRHAEVFDSVMFRTFSFINDADIFDPFLGTSLGMLFEAAGLEQIEIEEASTTGRGGEPMSVMFEMSWQRFDPVLIDTGVITQDEATARHEAFLDPAFSFSYGFVAGWGRRTQAAPSS
jgi:SAM-dependent methyltransferase